MRRAEITVFLSMVFILLVSFVLGILEISVIHTEKNLSRLETDREIFSVFGEYQKKLLEKYHVFSIDASYGTGGFSEERLINRMHYYGTGNTEHDITGIRLLTDNSGQSFREQVLEYMEERYGMGLIRDFTGLTEEWKEQSIQGQQIKAEEEKILDEFESLKETAGETAEEVPEENPFTCIEQMEQSGILSVVLPEEMDLSGKEIVPEAQVSQRARNTGRGEFKVRQGTDGIEERLLFNEYVLDNFSTAIQETEDSPLSLDYEIEYILSGKASDKENLESVVLKLFLIRMALNYTYLFGDTEKNSEASVLATAVAAIFLIPEGVEVLKQLILLAWAAGESIVDIRALLSGKKAALVKTGESWQLSLTELLTLGGGDERFEGEDVPGGISYEDYLRTFLFLTDPEVITMRVLDRIEENLTDEPGMDSFRADHCVTAIKMQNTMEIFGGLTYTYPVSFSYE